MCINRFDDDTKSSFLDLYKNIDASVMELSEEQLTVEHVFDDTVDISAWMMYNMGSSSPLLFFGDY